MWRDEAIPWLKHTDPNRYSTALVSLHTRNTHERHKGQDGGTQVQEANHRREERLVRSPTPGRRQTPSATTWT